MRKAAIPFIAALVLVGCVSATPDASQATVVPSAAQTHLPTPGEPHPQAAPRTPTPPLAATQRADVPTPPGQPAPTVQGLAFSEPSIGISFIYPAGWEPLPRDPDEPTGVTLHGPALGEGPEPIIFAITVDVETATEKSVKDIVDQQLEQVPVNLSRGIKRRTLDVGGESAEQVIGLPSLQGALETFVLHKGRLYLIILQPYDEGNESLLPYLAQERSIYGDLLASWTFLK